MFKNIYIYFEATRDSIESKIKKSKDAIFAYYSKLSKAKIDSIETEIGVKIPISIKKMYSTCNGIILDWLIDADIANRVIEGKTEIPTLKLLFNDDSYFYLDRKEMKEKIWKSEVSDEILHTNYYILDHCGDGNYAVFLIKDNQPLLYWYNAYGTLNKLSLTLEEYVDNALKFGGIKLWQEYFVEDFEKTPIRIISDHIVEDIKKINPNISKNLFHKNIQIDTNSQFHNYFYSKSKIDYYKMISVALTAFKKNNQFKKVKYTINPGVSIASLRRFHASYKSELPKELIEFYYAVNGFSLKWETECDGKIYRGSIIIQSLEDLMGGKQIKEWNDDVYKNQYWFDENDSYLLKSLKRFENIEGESSDIVISISKKSYDLYYLDAGNPVPLNMNIEEYVKKVLSIMGIEGWHLLYVPNSVTKGLDILTKEEIKAVFPDFKDT